MQTTETRFVCRHIFTDGRRCQSPTLRGGAGPEHFCYYHHTTRRPIPTMELRRRRACREPFHLPLPEDRSAIQHAIGEVIQRLAANEIDARRASILLHGLRIATLNLPKEIPVPQHYAAPLVDEVVVDPDHGLLAPQAEAGTTRPKASAESMRERLEREFPRLRVEKPTDQAEVVPILATLRASESPQNPHPLKTLRKNRGRARYRLLNRKDSQLPSAVQPPSTASV